MADFGKWKTIRSLSEGGQAHTFIVVDEVAPQSEYVLKRLKNVERVARFTSEVEACLQLDHPNIIRIVDHSFEAKRPFLVTEYCSNGTLAGINLTELSMAEKLHIFKQICEGVAYAHEKRITHRDLKPENIFLRENFSPVVGDFGICFIDSGGERFTLLDEAVGPRLYIAPELEDGIAETIRPSSDVYSLGKILYWLITGRIFSREKHYGGPHLSTANPPGS
jgi:serine/threonine protein kinase